MKHNFEDQDGVYDDDGNGPYDRRYPGQRVVADKGRVTVPLYMMDQSAISGRYRVNDSRSEAVRLRDEAHALMVDRMRNPKSYDPITGKRLDDGLAQDLSETDLYFLAKRLAPVLAIGMPRFAPGHPDEANEESTARENSVAGPSRDNRRSHYPKPVRDQAVALRLRDESYALMVDRMRNPKSYDKDGRRIASSSAR